MPPKQRITREMILETSFSMFCREGMENVNARSVAKALGCSTQPIFSYFSGMEDLKAALDSKAWALYEQELSQALAGENPLQACILAYYRFAAEQPHLFRSLFLTRRSEQEREQLGMGEELNARIVQAVAAAEGIDAQQAQRRYGGLRIFAHGLASLEAMKLLGMTREAAESMIVEATRNH